MYAGIYRELDRESKAATNMDKSDVDKARIFADLATAAFDPKQIFLFGFYAKGNYHEVGSPKR